MGETPQRLKDRRLQHQVEGQRAKHASRLVRREFVNPPAQPAQAATTSPGIVPEIQASNVAPINPPPLHQPHPQHAPHPEKPASANPPANPAPVATTYPATAPATPITSAVPLPPLPPHPLPLQPALHREKPASASPPANPALAGHTFRVTALETTVSGVVLMRLAEGEEGAVRERL